MPIFDGRGLRLDLKLDRGADYDFVVRWQSGLDLTGWTSWDCQFSCAGQADITIPVDAAAQNGANGFVILQVRNATVAECATRGERWGLSVTDPNGLVTPFMYGSVAFEEAVVPDA